MSEITVREKILDYGIGQEAIATVEEIYEVLLVAWLKANRRTRAGKRVQADLTMLALALFDQNILLVESPFPMAVGACTCWPANQTCPSEVVCLKDGSS